MSKICKLTKPEFEREISFGISQKVTLAAKTECSVNITLANDR